MPTCNRNLISAFAYRDVVDYIVKKERVQA
jgi:hypothetical protein